MREDDGSIVVAQYQSHAGRVGLGENFGHGVDVGLHRIGEPEGVPAHGGKEPGREQHRRHQGGSGLDDPFDALVVHAVPIVLVLQAWPALAYVRVKNRFCVFVAAPFRVG